MILEKLFNEISDCYGKKIKKYEISFIDEGHIFFELNFGEGENLMMKVWTKKDFNNYDKPFELLLFKDNIYSNEYIMKDLDNLHNFLKKFNSNSADYTFGNYTIEISKKMKEYLYKELNIQMNKYIKSMSDNICSDGFWIDSLTNVLETRRFLDKYFKYVEKDKNK